MIELVNKHVGGIRFSGRIFTALLTVLLSVAVLYSSSAVPAENISNAKYPNTWIQEKDKGADWYKKCLDVKGAAIPEQDIPPPSIVNDLRNCDAQELYYSATNEDDWIKSRYCAIVSKDDAALMMIYANGHGVTTNIDIATKHACRMAAAQAETSSRVYRLSSRTSDKIYEKFDQCDDATSTLMINTCAYWRDKISERNSQSFIENISINWTAQQKKAFRNLLDKQVKYADATGRNERVCLIDSWCGAAFVHHQANEFEIFSRNLKRIEMGEIPTFSADDFRALDKELNRVYQAIMSNSDIGASNSITKAMIRNVQRVWLEYRDAWSEFGTAKYSGTTVETWKAYATNQRIIELQNLDFEH